MVQATIRFEGQKVWMPRCLAWPCLVGRRGRSSRRSPTTASRRPAYALSTSAVRTALLGSPAAESRSPAGRRWSRAGASFAASPTPMAKTSQPGAAMSPTPASTNWAGKSAAQRTPPASACALTPRQPCAPARQSQAGGVRPRQSQACTHELARDWPHKIRMPARPFVGVNREDLWAMGRLTVQTIQAAEGGPSAR